MWSCKKLSRACVQRDNLLLFFFPCRQNGGSSVEPNACVCAISDVYVATLIVIPSVASATILKTRSANIRAKLLQYCIGKGKQEQETFQIICKLHHTRHQKDLPQFVNCARTSNTPDLLTKTYTRLKTHNQSVCPVIRCQCFHQVYSQYCAHTHTQFQDTPNLWWRLVHGGRAAACLSAILKSTSAL